MNLSYVKSHVKNDGKITSILHNMRLSSVLDVMVMHCMIIILIYIESILNTSGQCIFNEVNTWDA